MRSTAIRVTVFTVMTCLAAAGGAVHAMDTAFSFQGVLHDLGSPANGEYDFRFILYDSEVGGSQVGTTLFGDDITVADGLFTVYLDFGAGTFTGDDLWVEVAVRPGESSDIYTPLAPRQAVLPSPYALLAASIQPGAVGGQEIAGDSVTSDHIVDGTVTSSDTDTTSVQARVLGTCSAGSSIRSILSDGTVSCEVDDSGHTIHLSAEMHAESFNGHDSTYLWIGPPPQTGLVTMCFLTRVQLRDVDGGDENAYCRVSLEPAGWTLIASTEDGHDNDALCSMRCMYWY